MERGESQSGPNKQDSFLQRHLEVAGQNATGIETFALVINEVTRRPELAIELYRGLAHARSLALRYMAAVGVKALIEVDQDETLDLLFGLLRDDDARVAEAALDALDELVEAQWIDMRTFLEVVADSGIE